MNKRHTKQERQDYQASLQKRKNLKRISLCKTLEERIISFKPETEEEIQKYHNLLNAYNELQTKLDKLNVSPEVIGKYTLSPRNKNVINYLGAVCGLCEGKNELDVHYKCFLSDGGTHEFSNMQVLCHKCHFELHRFNPDHIERNEYCKHHFTYKWHEWNSLKKDSDVVKEEIQ